MGAPMDVNKNDILALITIRLRADLSVCEQAVAIARDTATHKDTQGSSRYETMGLEASYLAQGQGQRLLEIERALGYFTLLKLPSSNGTVALTSLVELQDADGNTQFLWLAPEAGGMKVDYVGKSITVVTPRSPLGRCLIGKQLRDCFEVTINGAPREYEVVSIH